MNRLNFWGWKMRMKRIGNWFLRNRYIFLLIFFVGFLFAGSTYIIYPSTTIRMAVFESSLDEKGKPKNPELKKVAEHLEELGITIEFLVQAKSELRLSQFEWAVNNPNIDTFLTANTGATFPEGVTEKFRSIGVTQKAPFYIYIKSNRNDIKSILDLKGKKIAYYLLPMKDGVSPFQRDRKNISPYTVGYIYGQIFNLAGIDISNTTFINTYPDPVTSNVDADAYVALYFSDGVYSKMYQDFVAGKLKFLPIPNLEALAIKLPHLTVGKLPAGGFNYEASIPAADVYYPAITASMAVRKDLDPSLVVALAEAYKAYLDKPTLTRAKGELPSFKDIETFKPHPAAADFYKTGRPFLGKYFSHNLSGFILKLALIILPLLTVVWPLMHFLPLLYRLIIKKKITNWYHQLEYIEKNYETADKATKAIFRIELANLDSKLKELKFPLMYGAFVQELFIAREHVELVKKKIDVVED